MSISPEWLSAVVQTREPHLFWMRNEAMLNKENTTFYALATILVAGALLMVFVFLVPDFFDRKLKPAETTDRTEESGTTTENETMEDRTSRTTGEQAVDDRDETQVPGNRNEEENRSFEDRYREAVIRARKTECPLVVLFYNESEASQ